MAYTMTAKLERGSRYILFDATGQFKLALDWVPPTINLAPSFATGPSSARYSSELKVDERLVSQDVVIPFHMTGISAAQIESGLSQINLFLRDAGDENEPVYFSWKNNNIPDPVWGQGTRRLRIEHGAAFFGDQFGVSSQGVPLCRLELRVSAIEGKPQQLAMAKGGTFDYHIATTDGQSRGVVVAEGTTNKNTNPVFGNGLTDWTAGASITAALEYSPEYTIKEFGGISAKLTRIGSVSSRYSQSLNVGNTNPHTLSFYAKRADSAAVTANDVSVYYGAIVASTYLAVGDGWYRVFATVDGVASSTDTGVSVRTDNRTIYITGYQTEEKALVTPLATGDMLGCSWSSTAHASTSVRAAGAMYIDTASSVLNVAGGAIAMYITPLNNSTALTSPNIIKVSGLDFRVIFRSSPAQWVFGDGTNEIVYNDSFSANDKIVLHVVWSPESGLALYKNGVSVVTGATYTPPALSTADLYIGSTATPTLWFDGIINGIKIWDNPLSATQIAADYADISPMMTAGRAINQVPWLWTVGGDGVVDSSLDSTHAPYAVSGGIDGDVPTSPFCRFNVDVTSLATSLFGAFYTHDHFIPQVDLFESKTTSVTNSAAEILTQTIPPRIGLMLNGKPIWIYTSMTDAGSGTLSTQAKLESYNYTFAQTNAKTIDPDSVNAETYIYSGLTYPGITTYKFDPEYSKADQYIKLYATRSTAGAANVVLSGMILFGGCFYVARSDEHMLIYNGRAFSVDDFSAAIVGIYPYTYIGDTLVLTPKKINHLFWANYAGGWNGDDIVLAKMIYTPIYISA